ncbi:glycosyltransferase family 2 protein [Acidovorax sp. FG27]|uniref:glycosyltransferase family 2 protein n=1 Tax=Acidovorax sp. FG27 TaxID=3133652 RepID=UPI0030E9246F
MNKAFLPPTAINPDFHAEFAPAAPEGVLPRAPLRLSCVVPAYNEGENLDGFLPALAQTVRSLTPDFEIVVINDGSRDATHEVALRLAQELPLRYIALSRNFGKEAALSAGIDHARGNAVLLIDADFQHPLEMVPQMHALWQSGFDMVYGVIADRCAESGAKRVGTNVFYRLMNAGNHRVRIPPHAGDFRWMDRNVADAMKALPERNRFMKGLYAWVGFKTAALPFVPLDRAAGVSSFNLRSLGSLALAGLTSFTTLPLRMWSLAGGIISLAALAYGLWIAVATLVFGNPLDGWPTLAASIMLFSGVQLMSIGILGEYIGRIYDEVKRRPIYLVARDEDRSPLRDLDERP